MSARCVALSNGRANPCLLRRVDPQGFRVTRAQVSDDYLKGVRCVGMILSPRDSQRLGVEGPGRA